MSDATELLELSQRFLDVIEEQDWESYLKLCDPTLTAYEPEAVGNLLTGLEFHRIYFESNRRGATLKSTISCPISTSSCGSCAARTTGAARTRTSVSRAAARFFMS